MKKLLVGLLVVAILAGGVAAVSMMGPNPQQVQERYTTQNMFRQGNLVVNREYNDCLKKCTIEKHHAFEECLDSAKEKQIECRVKFLECRVKAMQETNKSLSRQMSVDCSREFSQCLRNVNGVRNNCTRESVNSMQTCQKRCMEWRGNCLAIYDPVCDVNGVLYPNLCVLKSAGATLDETRDPANRCEVKLVETPSVV